MSLSAGTRWSSDSTSELSVGLGFGGGCLIATGEFELAVRTDGESVWLTRSQIAVLFGRDVKTIGKHIANARREELDGIPVVAESAATAADGTSYRTEHHRLDMVRSVGYRVEFALLTHHGARRGRRPAAAAA
ncbi:hypothetical protein [Agromyces larvae]|uniref:DNA-binding protein n=1 Tax=Agromyces larvae TaxID=2929802 RepID=A0ABY4CAF4_9MICO|nr:hypothetical protein [Agromyces larvae]UOE45670.1 hypothetical protein MTO99_07955 [Agromyces larvae]